MKKALSEEKTLSKLDLEHLSDDTACFVQQQAEDIRRLLRRTAQDIYEIGQKLLLVKDRLEHGDFLRWLTQEFDWSARTAQQFMNVARHFKSEKFSDLGFTPSALNILAAPSTPPPARKEALKRAKAGESITVKKAKEIKQRHINAKAITTSGFQSTETCDFASSIATENLPQSEIISNATPNSLHKRDSQKDDVSGEKQEIIAIYSKSGQSLQTKPLRSQAWWLSNNRHFLYCGEPESFFFTEQLPRNIALLLAFPEKRQEWPKFVPDNINSVLSLWTPYSDEDLNLLSEMVERALLLYTDGKDNVVFRGLPDPSLLVLAQNLDLCCYIAEPSFKRCMSLVEMWRMSGKKVDLYQK
ncbi:MAG: DUF3102 domain-containing protein [Leptolyngbya sp. SIO1D8]|nr:DUF3102 domain-containing protein [Leptolyngbya sp. SIO1D8]